MALSVKVKRKTKSVRIPKSYDEKYTGAEPIFDPEVVVSADKMADAYNYYNYHNDYSDARKFLVTYLKTKKYDKDVIEKITNLPETFHTPTIGWIARILSKGVKINQFSQQWFDANLQRLLDYEPIFKSSNEPRKITIQDRMNAQFSRCVAEIDEQLDLFFDDKIEAYDITKYLHENSVPGIVATRVSKHFQPLLEELQEALARKDEQLREAYKKYSRPKVKKAYEFLALICTVLGNEGHKAKVMRAPRKKKAKSAEQQVAKIKYMLSHKELNINSIKPIDIIGASQLWIYNTKTRKLGLYIAQDVGGLKVKGSTILSYDDKASICKKLRKPETVLPTITQGSKVALRTAMSNIKSVEAALTGRINGDTILLRAIK